MKTIYYLILPVCFALLSIYYVSMYLHKQQTTSAHTLKIAILTPITHPALEQVEQGVKQTMQKANSAHYTFDTFNANGNKTLLRAQAQEILNNTYDLIVTLGASASQTIAELAKKKGVTTPHVFCAVDGLQFAQQLVATNPSTTGVYVKTDYETEIDIIHKLKPSTKNILLVYDPTHGIGLEKDKKAIEEYLKKYGTSLTAVQVYNANEIQQKVLSMLSNVDVVLVLIDNTVVAGIDALITACNRYGVTLVASDLGSGEKGAAVAYGITEYESGAHAAQQALKIIKDGKKPHELPITAVTNFRVAINKNTMKAQKLDVSDAMIAELNAKDQQ